MLKPTALTIAILVLDEVYDDETSDYISEVKEGQEVFELVDELYLDDNSRQCVVKNSETGELWAINAWYNGDSWGDEPFMNEDDDDVYRVQPKEVTVIEYERVEEE